VHIYSPKADYQKGQKPVKAGDRLTINCKSATVLHSTAGFNLSV